jgi:hypothetical protein
MLTRPCANSGTPEGYAGLLPLQPAIAPQIAIRASTPEGVIAPSSWIGVDSFGLVRRLCSSTRVIHLRHVPAHRSAGPVESEYRQRIHDEMIADLRLAWRMFACSRGASFLIVAMLAVAIAGTLTLYGTHSHDESLARVAQREQLARIYASNPRLGAERDALLIVSLFEGDVPQIAIRLEPREIDALVRTPGGECGPSPAGDLPSA